MNYKEALEQNESKEGLDLSELTNENLISIIDELPGWDYPLAEDMMEEMARRAGIDTSTYFGGFASIYDFPDDGLPHGCDYNDLFSDCMDKMSA